jgi:uncharacterized protein (TIGR02391 family)
MKELVQAIPDVEHLLSLSPEDLGEKIIYLIKQRDEERFSFHLFEHELFGTGAQVSGTSYALERKNSVLYAIGEAWAWLQSKCLIFVEPGPNGKNGWMVLSRRALAMQTPADFASYRIALQFPREILHPAMPPSVWGAFVRGEYDVAVFQATKAVEVATRNASRLPASEVGRSLMQKAFSAETGPLADMAAERSERTARMDLFCGVIGSYKNPQSHRDVNLEDPSEAMEVILFANHLLRIISARSAEVENT